ncbi:MAG: hypothetical protein KAH09_01035 [Desulfobacula sp.]|nr:hypothetical protein [Desulfobacula sp.]
MKNLANQSDRGFDKVTTKTYTAIISRVIKIEDEFFLPQLKVSEGRMRAVGKVVNKNSTQFIAESIVYGSNNKEVGRGNGVFVRSKLLLSEVKGYGA